MKAILVALIIVSLLPEQANAQDCVDYERYMHWEGWVNTPGRSRAVTIAGNFAFIADDTSGMQIIDILQPDRPSIVGAVDTPGNAFDVSVRVSRRESRPKISRRTLGPASTQQRSFS